MPKLRIPVYPTEELTTPPLKKIPKVIRRKGRVRGFEALRDKLLTDTEAMLASGLSLYNVIKLVIELDRHALFAGVQEEKQRGKFDTTKYDEMQKYLEGEVQLSEMAEPTEAAALSELIDRDEFSADDEEETDEEEEEQQ